jgi:branched-chain amino acid transport system permease protein
MDFQTLAQLLLPGLTTGCVYALIALGFVLCFNVSGVVNMAQGEFVMLGGMLGAWLSILGVPLPVAVLGATAAGAVLGVLQERLTLAPVRSLKAQRCLMRGSFNLIRLQSLKLARSSVSR